MSVDNDWCGPMLLDIFVQVLTNADIGPILENPETARFCFLKGKMKLTQNIPNQAQVIPHTFEVLYNSRRTVAKSQTDINTH
jgi:hypothetical protein